MPHTGETTGRTHTVALLGTGIMGAGIARNLREHSFDVQAWNRTRAKVERLTEHGVHVTGTPAEAVKGADVIITMLSDGPRVLEVMTDAAPGLARGVVWAQLSTVGVEAMGPLADFADEHGLGLVDAPVLGTKQPAEQGQLIVLAAGPASAREVVQPVFDAIGKRTLWVADSAAGGAASRLKLVVNSWVLALNHGAAEALAIAKGLGVDPNHFLDAVAGGATDTPYLHAKAKAILADDYTPSFGAANAAKDARLIVEAASEAGVHVDITAAGLTRFRRVIDKGYGDKDMAVSYLASFDD
jgi:3-hydroxyisobutyrate dehydrogenase